MNVRFITGSVRVLLAKRRALQVRVIGVVLLTTAVVFAVWLGLTVVAEFDRGSPLTDVKVTVTSNDPIVPGSTININVDAFYSKSCETTIHRRIFDSHGKVYVLPELHLSPTPPGPRQSVSIVALSDTIAPGQARYVSDPYYACNWFERWIWPISEKQRTGAFVVVEPK